MTPSSTPAAGDDRRRDMSPEEKLIAQWEARHDVAARGHRADPLGLQHCLARERLADRVRPPRGATASGRLAEPGASPVEPRSGEPDAAAVDPGSPPARTSSTRRHPWWRLHHHPDAR